LQKFTKKAAGAYRVSDCDHWGSKKKKKKKKKKKMGLGKGPVAKHPKTWTGSGIPGGGLGREKQEGGAGP